LAVYADTRFKTEIFVGTRDSVDMIQMQQDTKGNVVWRYESDLFVMEKKVNATQRH